MQNIFSILNLSYTNTLLIYLTHFCNYSCYYCTGIIDIQKHIINIFPKTCFINSSKLIKFLQHQKKYKNIIFYGGEPTLHPQLKNIAILAKQYGYKLFIMTNFSAPIKLYNSLIDIGVMLILTWHYQNITFTSKILNFSKNIYINVMFDKRHFNNAYNLYVWLNDHMFKNIFCLQNDYDNYSINQKNILNKNNAYNFSLILNKYNVLTSAGNIYLNDNLYVNGTNPTDNMKNIINSIA